MTLNLSPHQFSAHPDTGTPVLTRVTPYLRLSSKEFPPVFLQQGNVYSEGGQLIEDKDWPPFVEDAIRKLTLAARKDVGFEPVEPPKDPVQNLNTTPGSEPKTSTQTQGGGKK